MAGMDKEGAIVYGKYSSWFKYMGYLFGFGFQLQLYAKLIGIFYIYVIFI